METLLTSVKLVRDIYEAFKVDSIRSGMTFQRFANYSLKKYNTDPEFQKEILLNATGSTGV